jgi:ribonuclease HI
MRWLGIYFDRKLTFKEHIRIMTARASSKVDGLRILGNTVKGLSAPHLRHLYKAVVIPTLTFAAPVWYTGKRQKGLIAKLETVQNKMLRQICGAFRTTPTRALCLIASVPPIQHYLPFLQQGTALRFLRLPTSSHPIARLPDAWRNGQTFISTPSDRFNNRNKKTNLLRIAALVDSSAESLFPFHSPPWEEPLTSHPRFSCESTSSSRKKDKDEEKQRTEETIRKLNDDPNQLVVFTDGSVSDGASSRAGTGVVIQARGRPVFEKAICVRDKATSFDTEVFGLCVGLSFAIKYAQNNNIHNINIFSDSSSAISSIPDTTPHPAQFLSIHFVKKARAFLDCKTQHRITIQWLPSHCGITGNERADELAREGTSPQLPAVFSSASLSYLKAKSKKDLIKDWTKEWRMGRQSASANFRPFDHPPSLRPSKSFKSLQSKKEIFGRMTQLFTGHGYNGEYYARFVPDNDTACNADHILNSRNHILLYCSKYEQHRHILRKISPNLSIQTLLRTNKGLMAVAKFIEKSGAFTRSGSPYIKRTADNAFTYEPP